LSDKVGEHTVVLGKRVGVVKYEVERVGRIQSGGEIMVFGKLGEVLVRPEVLFKGATF